MMIELTEDQRQAVLLALAHLAIVRPGWKNHLWDVAETLNGTGLWERFYTMLAQETSPNPPPAPDPLARFPAVPVPPPRCQWCSEPLTDARDTFVYANGPMAHTACALRQVIGSVAHLEGRCSCVVSGASEGDPPGMTRREAALAAVRIWEAQHGGTAP